MNRVYIIQDTAWNQIESVWETRELAKSAILYHATDKNVSPNQFVILERELNVASTNLRKRKKGK
jgi:hypothetical protein